MTISKLSKLDALLKDMIIVSWRHSKLLTAPNHNILDRNVFYE